MGPEQLGIGCRDNCNDDATEEIFRANAGAVDSLGEHDGDERWIGTRVDGR